ncbi:iron uptake protein [Undibacterium sp. CY18W]|uniref:Iron uptake protein n=1 Tax=Undibacterium hunanense TaxID=2762292 RepID=A0ABR6ZMM2_9BURK|nr:iron uptake protein [Undibacterium hunanense]MBC3917134.1 iron uptake protein [Undibacterium hunanense]
MASHAPAGLALAHRLTAAILGAYIFAWGFITLAMAGLFALGMSFHDAEHLSSILVFLVYLGAFLWAFIAKRAKNMLLVWLLLGGGGALMAACASLLQYILV